MCVILDFYREKKIKAILSLEFAQFDSPLMTGTIFLFKIIVKKHLRIFKCFVSFNIYCLSRNTYFCKFWFFIEPFLKQLSFWIRVLV